MQRLQQRTIFITGASSGIGKSCAEQFAEAGANVILTARRLDRITALAAELEQQYGIKALPIQLDVQKQKDVQTAIANLPAEWANIDVLVNNAGLALTSDLIQDSDPDNWSTMIDTNIKGLLYVTRAIVPIMLANKKGHIINISSIAGNDHYRGGNVYSATKHAVRALSRSMHIDLLGENIRVSDVAPGLVETEFSEVR
jgi:NADP-dependent 3-hydroxy acid dehydrogenase YdfG